MRNLKSGLEGEDVKNLQRILNTVFGYNLQINGIFGLATEQAVKDFQFDHGLTVDGIVGQNTWNVLNINPNTIQSPFFNMATLGMIAITVLAVFFIFSKDKK